MSSTQPTVRQYRIVNTEPATVISVPCTHCGSAKTQAAIRAGAAITFRCLHCWKTFTRTVESDPVPPSADAA